MKKIIAALLAAGLLTACGVNSVGTQDSGNIAGAPASIDAPDGGVPVANEPLSTGFPETVTIVTPETIASEYYDDRLEQTQPPVSDDVSVHPDTAPEQADVDPDVEIYTPVDEAADDLHLEVEAFEYGATYRIINGTDDCITFGTVLDYHLEVYDTEADGNWVDVETDGWPVTNELLSLPAGKVFKASVGWSDTYGKLETGKYRLVKSVNTGGDEPVYLYAEFNVYGDAEMLNNKPVNFVDGMSMTVSDVTPSGLTYSLVNNGDVEFETGSEYEYMVQSYDVDGWNFLEYEDDWDVDAIAIIIAPGTNLEATVDWTSHYGELPAGKYRIVKGFDIARTDGGYDAYYAACEFEIK